MADQNPANTSFGGQSILSRVSSFRSSHRISFSISLLDDHEQISVQFKGSALGQEVLDAVCDQIDVVERDYFGLRYLYDGQFRFWLDLTKPINKQFKGDFVSLSLRIRFYPKDAFLLKEEVTRYQLFVQLRRDLLHGRLFVPQALSVQLAGLVLQSVLGDYDPAEHLPGYVSEYQLLLKQTERHEEQISAAHKDLAGMTPADAESRFLAIATEQKTYGFDPYIVKVSGPLMSRVVDYGSPVVLQDVKHSQDFAVGATNQSVLIFSKNVIVSEIPWEQLSKIDYTGKELRLYPTRSFVEHAKLSGNGTLDLTVSTVGSGSDSDNVLNGTLASRSSKSSKKSSSKKQQFKFVCPNTVFAKHLWRHLLSQQAFFTEDSARQVKPKFSKPRIPLFTRGSTFRLPTKRVLHEIENDSVPLRENEPHNFHRYALPKQLPRVNLSASSRSATLRSLKSTSSPTSSTTNIDENGETGTLRNEPFKTSTETLTKDINGPRASTPVHSDCSLPQFTYTPIAASTSREHVEIVNTTTESASSTTSVKSINENGVVRDSVLLESPMVQSVVQTDETTFETVLPNSNGNVANGKLPNGHFNGNILPDDDENDVVVSDTVVKKALRGILSITLLLITLSTFAIVTFESNNGIGPQFTRDVPTIAGFRQVFYEPAKDAIQQFIHRFY